MKNPKVTVVGSINMDLVVESPKRPVKGETIVGTKFYTMPGGKGANQAVAAAKLGAEVNMIGLVGDDLFGKELIESLKENHVFTDSVESVPHTESGIASITLAEEDNSIIVVAGANAKLTAEIIAKYEVLITSSDIVLVQLEIPIETVRALSELCKKSATKLILNPAPAQQLDKELIRNCYYLTPNQVELEQIIASQPDVMEQFSEKFIVTDGENGAYYFRAGKKQTVKSFPAKIVDTTGAGDCFNGALAYALAKGEPLDDAIKFANAAASLAVQRLGAQNGMPDLEEVQKIRED